MSGFNVYYAVKYVGGYKKDVVEIRAKNPDEMRRKLRNSPWEPRIGYLVFSDYRLYNMTKQKGKMVYDITKSPNAMGLMTNDGGGWVWHQAVLDMRTFKHVSKAGKVNINGRVA